MAARGADFLSVFSSAQQDALAMLFLRLSDHINTTAELLRGMWLVLNGSGYVIVCFTGIFAPRYQAKVSDWSFPVLFGEVAPMLRLVMKGAKPPALAAATAS